MHFQDLLINPMGGYQRLELQLVPIGTNRWYLTPNDRIDGGRSPRNAFGM